MNTTDPIVVTDTPADLVADHSIPAGSSYTVQNVGTRPVYLAKRSPGDTPILGTAGAQVINRHVFLGITVDAGEAYYVWTLDGLTSSVVLTQSG